MPDAARSSTATADQLLGQAIEAVDAARSLGAQDAFATVARQRGLEFQWRDGQLEKVQEDASRSLAIALYVDGRYSAHTTHDLDPERLKVFLHDAIALTRHLQPDPHRAIPDPALYAGRSRADLDLVDASLPDLSRDDRIAWCASMCEAASADERVVSATTSVQDDHGTIARASSNGFAGTMESTSIAYGAMVTLKEGATKRPEAAWYVAGTHQKGLPSPEAVGEEALKRAVERLGSTRGDSARTTMIVHPEAAAMLLGRMLGAMTAGSIQQNQSFLAGKQGEAVASPVLHVTDDPLLPGALGSRTFDREGIAAKPFVLLRDGILENHYVDTYYGRKLGWAPTTGSASNVVIRPGDKDLEALAAAAGDAILVTSWLGGNANMTTGDFSFGVRGHVVTGGRIGAPISEMNVTGSYPELMQQLVEVGNDPVPWYTVRVPTLVFSDIQFSGN